MKKILLVLNGPQAPVHIITAAVEIAKADKAFLHALFLVPAISRPTLLYPFINDLALTGTEWSKQSIEQEDQHQANDSIRLFKDACTAANVFFKISPDGDISFEQLIHHTAFADLIITDAGADFPETPSMPLTVSLGDLLADAHCPVLLLQEEIKQPDRVIFSYDGSFSSVHAIKMFSYVFPEWRATPATLLCVLPRENARMEYEEYIKDLLPQHFTSLNVQLLIGDAKKELLKTITNSGPNTLVVMGAYGRTAIGRLFHKSLSNTLLKETKAALFISHERMNAT